MARLLWWKARIEFARLRRTKGMTLAVIILTPFFLGSAYAMQNAFAILGRVTPLFAEGLFVAAYASVGVFQVVAGFRWGVTRLFLNSDLELLITAPVTQRALFAVKVAELVAASPISILVLVLITWSYARLHAPVAAPFLALVAPILLAAVAVLPGMVIALLLASAMTGPRLRTLIGVISPLIPLIWIFAVGPAVGFVGTVNSRHFDPARFEAVGRSLTRDLRAVPTTWVADIVRGVAYRDWLFAGHGLLLVTLVAIPLVFVAFSLFFSTFERSWARLSEASTRKRRGTLVERIAPALRPAPRAVLIKEWRTFPRDLRTVQQLVFPLLIIGFFSFNASRTNGTPPYGLIFFLAFLFPNLAAATLLAEKRNLGLIKLAPIRGRDLIVGKLVAYALPLDILLAGVTIAFGVVKHQPIAFIALGVVFIAWIATGAMLGGLGIAALWGSFDLERPRLTVLPAFAEMVILGLFAVAQAGLGLWLAARAGAHVGGVGSPIAGIPLLAFAACMATVVFILASSGANRLETMDAP